MTRWLRLAASAVALLLLAGCEAQPASGLMEFGGEPGRLCTATAEGEQVLLGDVLTPLESDIQVESVRMDKASGVELEKAYFLPLVGAAIGSSELPPSEETTWADRQEAEGAVLEAGKAVNIVLLVRRTSEQRAEFAAIDIDYTQGGITRRNSGSTSYVLEDSC